MTRFIEWTATKVVVTHNWISDVKVNKLDKLMRDCVSASKVHGTVSENWDMAAHQLVDWIRKEIK